MNAIEQRISTTYAPAILNEIRTELDGLRGKIADKNWNRMNDMLRARARTLARGPVEEILQPVANLAPSKVKRMGKMKRKIGWIAITETDGKGRIYQKGWKRPPGSRKSHLKMMLKEPRLLFDPTKAKPKAKKKTKTKPKAKKETL